MWNLNNTLLNSHWAKEEIKKLKKKNKTRKYLKTYKTVTKNIPKLRICSKSRTKKKVHSDKHLHQKKKKNLKATI